MAEAIGLAGAAVVKNEADIIEPFVRHALRLLDELRVTDNGSSDGTWEILEALKAEGLPLTLTRDDRLNHPQSDIITAHLAKWGEPAASWVFCLDADEFLDVESVDQFRATMAALSDETCIVVPWTPFVPMDTDDPAELNPIVRIQHRRTSLADPWHSKLVVPARFLNQPGLEAGAGNHMLRRVGGGPLPHAKCDAFRLAHFPVRSALQIAKKGVTGDWAISARTNRQVREGFHWRDIRRRVLAGETLQPDELTRLAYNYSTPEALTASPLTELERRPVLPPDFQLKYTTPDQQAFLEDAVAFADRHFEGLRTQAMDCGGVRVAKTKYGPMAYSVGDLVIGRSLAEHGEWAGPEIDFILGYVKPGDVVVDVGANIGTHAVPLARRVGPSGQVIAFEPQRLVHQLLCTNVTLNDLDNVRTERVAVGAAPGTVAIPVRKRGNLGNIGHEAWGKGEPTPLITLDSLELPKLSLLKIDVEGMEREVLQGAAQTIRANSPVLFVENNTPELSPPLISWLFDAGYRCWWFLDPYFNPKNFNENPVDFLAHVPRPEINMICLPADAEAPEALVEVTDANDSWEPAWEKQGRKGYRPPKRFGKPPTL